MKFTGERYIPELSGEIQFEHLNRYFSCLDLAIDKEVLDIACGEGYGSSILAKLAKRVVGVDIDSEAVDHASLKYQSHHNLKFLKGSCSSIPLADKSVDIVVSFETIEHHDQHEEMMKEIHRVLRDDGFLIISSPNRLVYSDKPNYSNPFHIKELYYEEFVSLLNQYFNNVEVYGQRLGTASFIYPLEKVGFTNSYTGKFYASLGTELQPFNIDDPVYYFAICSKLRDCPPANQISTFIDPKVDLWNLTRLHASNIQSQLEQTQSQLEQTQSQLEQTQSQLEQTQSQLEQTQSQLEQTQSQLEQTQSQLQIMQSSKFWKLREKCFRLKQTIFR